MFNIGTGEIIVFVVVAVVILGPKETAAYVRKIRRFFQQLKEYKTNIETEIRDKEHSNDDE